MIFALSAFLAGMGLAVAESIFLRPLEVAGLRPDIVVAVVVVATSRLSFGRVMVMAFALGFARDLFSGGLVGMSSFSLILMAYVLITAEDFLLTDNWKAQTFVAFLGYLIFGTLITFLKVLAGFEITSALQAVQMIVGTAAFTSVLGPPGFAVSARPEGLAYTRLKQKRDFDHETIHQAEV